MYFKDEGGTFMRNRTIMLSVLLCILIISSVFAATYSSSRTIINQRYTVTARAYWTYETGRFSSMGSPTIIKPTPPSILIFYDMLVSGPKVSADRYTVTQSFTPVTIYHSGESIRGTTFDITLKSTGPRSVDF